MSAATIIALTTIGLTAAFLICSTVNMAYTFNQMNDDKLFYERKGNNTNVSSLIAKTKAIHSIFFIFSVIFAIQLVHGFCRTREGDDVRFLYNFSSWTNLIFWVRLIVVLARHRVDGCAEEVEDCAFKITGDYYVHHAVTEYVGLPLCLLASNIAFFVFIGVNFYNFIMEHSGDYNLIRGNSDDD